MIAKFVLLLLLIPAAAFAQEPPTAQIVPETHTLTVAATGTVQRTPDRAVVRLAVESFGATAEEASAENARLMDAVIAALRRLGVHDNQIRTVVLRIDPEYDYNRDSPRQPGQDHLIGFRARNTVQVTVDEIDRVGEIVDAAIGAGANRVDGLSFQLRDPDEARRAALVQAIATARAEAETAAAALGRRLGPALTVSTTGSLPVPVRADYAMAARAGSIENLPPPPVQSGEINVQATVMIVYRLEPPR